MSPRLSAAVAASTLALFVFGAACSSSGAGGREVAITQKDDGCTPTRVDVTPGEKLKLVVKNEASSDYEIEGIDGAKLEELLVPKGRTRTPGYSVPSAASGTYKLKCYVPAGAATIIELVAGSGAAATTPEARKTTEKTIQPVAGLTPSASTIRLSEWKIEGAPERYAPGIVDFTAVNDSTTMVHELAVLKVLSDGSLDFNGETDELQPGQSGSVSILLDPGTYQLACLIIPGEAGSTVDHLKQGMKTRFVVE